MKSILHILLHSILILFMGLSLCACSEKRTDNLNEGLPQEIREIAIAIIKDSPQEFASVISYPIERPYPLKNVKDSTEMVKYYPTLMDDTIKKAVKESPDSAWQYCGWRGWTLNNGSYFWIDDGKIYEVTYTSTKENIMLDSLRNIEISTLEPSLQAGWTPVMCVQDTDSGELFRIDLQDGTNPPIYRLAGYNPGADLSGEPEYILYGSLELEGSMANRFYHFIGEDGSTAQYSPDVISNEDTPQIEIEIKGHAKRYKAKPDYWLDHIRLKQIDRKSVV